MIRDLPLWDHQIRAVEQTRESFRTGHNLPLVVMPTGAGKTHTAGHMAAGCIAKGGKVLWIAHREELVSQGYDSLTAWGLSCGTIAAKSNRPINPHRPVQVASIQTLIARGLAPDATFLIIDEAHHGSADSWSKLIDEYRRRKTRGIGLTATPVRGDGRALGDVFDDLLVPVRMKELVDNGVLVPCTIHGPGRKLGADEIAQLPVDAYRELAFGRKTIVFASNVKAANEFKDQFVTANISADLVTGVMDTGERRRVLADFKTNRIQVLCNVGVLTEGFDDPETSCIILARSLGSLGLYLQITGRGLRACKVKGKIDLVIIDLHGSSRVFGHPSEDREYSLDGDGIISKNAKRGPERFCMGCGCLIVGDATICEECHIMRPELTVPTVVKTKLVRYETKLRESPEQRKAYFEKLKGIAEERSYSPWWAHTKFKAVYGERPPKGWWHENSQ